MRLPAFLALGPFLAAPLSAAPYIVDKSHAQVTFSVSHLGYSRVHGQFRRFDAAVDFNPEAVENTQVRVTIDPASIDTNWEKRDAHLRDDDFFDVENHPEITFVSTGVAPTGPDTASVTGDLTIKGITREVTFDATLNKMAESPLTRRIVAGFSATGTIDRTQFDMGYAAPAVSAEVPIRIELEMSPAE